MEIAEMPGNGYALHKEESFAVAANFGGRAERGR
jgi:hypothetical protein